MAFGVCTNCFSSFPPSTGQKWKILLNIFFDIVTTYNDEICYVKHALDPLCVFLAVLPLLFTQIAPPPGLSGSSLGRPTLPLPHAPRRMRSSAGPVLSGLPP